MHFDLADFCIPKAVVQGGQVLPDGILNVGQRLFLGVTLRPTAGSAAARAMKLPGRGLTVPFPP